MIYFAMATTILDLNEDCVSEIERRLDNASRTCWEFAFRKRSYKFVPDYWTTRHSIEFVKLFWNQLSQPNRFNYFCIRCAQDGNLPLLELAKERGMKMYKGALKYAIECLDTFVWLYNNGCEWTPKLDEEIISGGHLEVFLFARSIGREFRIAGGYGIIGHDVTSPSMRMHSRCPEIEKALRDADHNERIQLAERRWRIMMNTLIACGISPDEAELISDREKLRDLQR